MSQWTYDSSITSIRLQQCNVSYSRVNLQIWDINDIALPVITTNSRCDVYNSKTLSDYISILMTDIANSLAVSLLKMNYFAVGFNIKTYQSHADVRYFIVEEYRKCRICRGMSMKPYIIADMR